MRGISDPKPRFQHYEFKFRRRKSMSNHLITLLVGDSPVHFPQPISLTDVLRATNGHGDPMNPIVGAMVNGRVTDLSTEITSTSTPTPFVVDWIYFRDLAARELLRHS